MEFLATSVDSIDRIAIIDEACIATRRTVPFYKAELTHTLSRHGNLHSFVLHWWRCHRRGRFRFSTSITQDILGSRQCTAHDIINWLREKVSRHCAWKSWIER